MKKVKEKILIVVMTFLGSGVILFSFVLPLLADIKHNSESLIHTRAAKEELTAEAKIPKDDQQKLEDFLKSTEDLFLPDQTPVNVILFLKQLEEKHDIDLDINLIQPSDNTDEMWNYLNVKISLMGDASSFFHFVEEIETDKLLIKIYEANIEKKENRQLAGNLSLKFFTRNKK